MPSSGSGRSKGLRRQKTGHEVKQGDMVMALTADDLAGSNSSLDMKHTDEASHTAGLRPRPDEVDDESTSYHDQSGHVTPEAPDGSPHDGHKMDDLFMASSCTPASTADLVAVTSKQGTKKHRWKSFKSDMRKATAFVKEKVTPKRRKKNDVVQISLKPEGICEETGKLECWTMERRDSWRDETSASPVPKNGLLLEVSDSRTGSGRSVRSSFGCESVYDEDGIETVYDAKYQGNL